MKKSIKQFTEAALNSYAILFFSQNKVLGFLLLLVSFVNVDAGITGAVCVAFSIIVLKQLGFAKENIQTGLYSFNILLLGIGFGTFFHFNVAFWVWLFSAGLLCVMLTIVLCNRLAKNGLPVLSLPFILSFWVALSAANGFAGMGLDQKNSALLNEMSNAGAQSLTGIIHLLEGIKLPYYFDLFFRSLSAILFQDNVFAGMLIALGILIHSRIAFSLMLVGFAAACLFNSFSGTFPGGISYYHLGSNLMMVSGGIGGFFMIPSARSYLWAVISVIIAILLISALTRVMSIANLPVFSLPFCVLILVLLSFFKLRTAPGKLPLTPLQHYSPEVNLYQYLNGLDRLQDLRYLRLSLPFMGSWKVSQGYNGHLTHKGDWGKALDFVINDEDGKSYKAPGIKPEDYYAFGKPVLACADGTIEEAVGHIDDNEIGDVNTLQNWGNSVVIKHTTGLYTKVSHLKKGSLKVKQGDFVKQGDVIALCGNSGRSPEPHLHFQVQTTPYIGSKTFEYPIAYFVREKQGNDAALHSFEVPPEGAVVKQLALSSSLRQAFSLPPGYSAVIETEDGHQEVWDVYTDALNQSYIYSAATGATAYFVNNGTAFYFTAYYGKKDTLLFCFFMAAYKIILSTDGITTHDQYPLQLGGSGITLWLHDLFAPFHQFITRNYQSSSAHHQGGFLISSAEHTEILGKRKKAMDATIQIAGSAITGFTINLKGREIKAKWYSESI